LAYVRQILEVEANSATDNPLIFAADEEVLSGGNFHGQPVAQVLDLLSIAIADLGSICERRIARLTDASLSGLPAFLTKDPGVNSGLMMAQIVAAALVADMRQRAHPASVDSVPTDANKEDHVSMGVHAAIKAREVVRIMQSLLAIELMTAAQALEFLKPLKPGRRVGRAYDLVRERVAVLEQDRVLSGDIAALEDLVRSGQLATLWQSA
jgi:histidine ammonia-lyase